MTNQVNEVTDGFLFGSAYETDVYISSMIALLIDSALKRYVRH